LATADEIAILAVYVPGARLAPFTATATDAGAVAEPALADIQAVPGDTVTLNGDPEGWLNTDTPCVCTAPAPCCQTNDTAAGLTVI
jgi:hypothetical protein